MTRLYISLPILLTLAGCGGPIETRVQTHMVAPISAQKHFMFSSASEPDAKIIKSARGMVGDMLAAKGFQHMDAAQMLIQIGLADRPASIAVSVGEDGETMPIAGQKEQKPLQSCRDREHRLTITMIDQTNGAILYSGAASEYHCKGKIEASL